MVATCGYGGWRGRTPRQYGIGAAFMKLVTSSEETCKQISGEQAGKGTCISSGGVQATSKCRNRPVSDLRLVSDRTRGQPMLGSGPACKENAATTHICKKMNYSGNGAVTPVYI